MESARCHPWNKIQTRSKQKPDKIWLFGIICCKFFISRFCYSAEQHEFISRFAALSFRSAFVSHCFLCDLRHVTTVFLHPFVLSLICSLNSLLLSTLHLQDTVLGAVDEVMMHEMLSSPQQTWKTNERGNSNLHMCVCCHSVISVSLWPHGLWGSPVQGIFQTRILEWVAISYSRGSSCPRHWTHVSCISCIGRWILYHRTTWEPFAYAWSLSHGQFLCSRDFPGKSTEVGCHFLLQGIFLTQGSKLNLLYLLHSRQILYPLRHQGNPLFAYIRMSTSISSKDLPEKNETEERAILRKKGKLLSEISSSWMSVYSQRLGHAGTETKEWLVRFLTEM